MKRLLVAALGLILFASPALAGTITASSTDAAWTAVKTGKPGDVVLLTADVKGILELDNFNVSAPGITIQPAPGAAVVLTGIIAKTSQGLNFSGLDVQLTPTQQYGVYLGTCSRITLSGMTIHQALGTDLSGAGIFIRGCTDVAVTNSQLNHLGSAAGFLESQRLTFTGNALSDIQTDGIFGEASHVLVASNTITDFHPAPGDHPDAIQLWGSATGSLSDDVIVRDNTITRGSGEVVQGIFFENSSNVSITGNAMLGTMYNGIALSNVRTAKVAGNFVQSYVDMGSRIIARGGSDTIAITDNTLSDPVINLVQVGDAPVTNFSTSGNTVIKPAAVGDASALNAWLVAKGSPVVVPPVVTPPTPPVVVVDTRDAQITALTTQVAGLNAQITTLTKSVSDATAQVAAAKAQLATTQAQATAAAAALKAANGNVSTLSGKVAAAQAALK